MVELSVRQREVLTAAARGLSVPQTGQSLYLSPNTVKTYRKQVLKQLRADNMAHAVSIALTAGLITGV
jgi:DNA-binding NarL/FixJ family response regulator